MRKVTTSIATSFAAILAAAVMLGHVAAASAAAETFTATANVKTAAGATVTAPVTITITRWTSDVERTKAQEALKAGAAAFKTAMAAMPDIGTIQVADRKTPLKFARAMDTGGGKLVTIVAAQPIVYLGAGVPEAKPKTGYDHAFATFEVGAAGTGTAGDLAPAAKLKMNAAGTLVVEDYGVEAVRLTAITAK